MIINEITIYAKSRPKPSSPDEAWQLSLDYHTRLALRSLGQMLKGASAYEGPLGILEKEELQQAAFVAVLLHDAGKVHYGFQKKIYQALSIDAGKLITAYGKQASAKWLQRGVRHEAVSFAITAALETAARDLGILSAERLLSMAAFPIILHHYNDYYEKLLSSSPIIDRRELAESLDEVRAMLPGLLTSYARISKEEGGALGIKALREAGDEIGEFLELVAGRGQDLEPTLQGIQRGVKEGWRRGESGFDAVLGLLMRADHFASGEAGFRDFESKPLQVEMPPIRDIADRVKARFPGSWQERLLEALGPEALKGGLCVVAPTGSGKTELALMRNGNKKLIYVLPIRASLNDMYHRRLGGSGYAGEGNVGLLHSTGFIEFHEAGDYIEEHVLEKRFLSKNLSYPVVLATPDQVLLISLGYHGHEKLLTYAPYAHLVIDEVQAYNPEMFAMIALSAKEMMEFGSRATVITATLPPFMKDVLEGDLGMRGSVIDLASPPEGLAKLAGEVKNMGTPRHVLDLEEAGSEEEELRIIEERVKEALSDAGNSRILVVVNTVPTAIRAYERLREALGQMPGVEVFLVHSRMLESRKGEVVRKATGASAGRQVIVATQVIEASVDIDADVMVTELSSADSLVQRMGRVYRNREGGYLKGVPNVYVIVRVSGGQVANPSHIYDSEVLSLTYRSLVEGGLLGKPLAYFGESQLVKEVFGSDDVKKRYMKAYDEAKKYLSLEPAASRFEAQRIFRNISSVTVCVLDALSEAVREKLSGGSNLSTADLVQVYSSSISLPYFVAEKYKNYLNEISASVEWRTWWLRFVSLRDKSDLELVREEGLEALMMKEGERFTEEEWIV